jgi:predicted  nucleic acid-binding Zn-ribbon protein
MDFNKRMAIIEYLLFKFKRTVADFVKRPQGTNEELAKAQAALQEAQNEISRIETKKNELQEKSNGTGVAAMRAKNELEQLLSQDNTELNKRTLTAEAAVRRAQKLGGEAAQGALWWINRELEELKKYKVRFHLTSHTIVICFSYHMFHPAEA